MKKNIEPDFVTSAIKSLPKTGRGQNTRTWSFILCPFHKERTPSLQVWHDVANPSYVGTFKCRGCGVSGGWNKLAEAAGLPKPERRTIGEASPINVDDLVVNQTAEVPDFIQFRRWPKNQERWRGFSFEYLETKNAKPFRDTRTSQIWLYLPVNVKGKEVGHIRARWEKEKDDQHSTSKKTVYKPSYINASGQWSKSKGLFLYDEAFEIIQRKKLDYVVLCEGPRDGLRLQAYDIPAISILGTHSWSNRKVDLISMLGVRRVILCFDADEAGRKGARLLKTGIDSEDRVKAKPLSSAFKVITYKLPEGYDPGNAPKYTLTHLKNL